MSNLKIQENFISNLKCQNRNHENCPIEFVCEFSDCANRLACVQCVLNEHSDHFEGMKLIPNYFRFHERGSSSISECRDNHRVLFTKGNPEDMKNTFFRQFDQQLGQFFIEMRDVRAKFNNKINETLKAIMYSKESTVSKFEAKLKDFLEHNSQFSNLESKTVFPKLISNKSDLLQFLNSKYKKNPEISRNDKFMECIISMKALKENPVSGNYHIIAMIKASFQRIIEQLRIFTPISIERLAFVRRNNYTPELVDGDFIKYSLCKSIPSKHKKPIYKLVFFDNEKKYATASDDSTIHLWNASDDSNYAKLIGHSDRIWEMILLRNKKLATSSSDFRVKIWNLETLKCDSTLIGHNGFVCSLLELPGNILVSGSQDKKIIFWNYETSKIESNIFNEGQERIMAIALCSVNEIAVGSNSLINIYNLDSKEFQFSLKGHTALVRDFLFIDSKEILLSCSDDHNIISWNFHTRCKLMIFKGHTLSANKLLLWNENMFFSCGDDGNIFFWNVNRQNGKPDHKIIAGKSWITSMTMMRDGTLCTVGADKIIKFWNSNGIEENDVLFE